MEIVYLPGDSFSDVILREVPETLQTAGEVLDYLKSQRHKLPKADPILHTKMLEGRGRRSKRKS